MAVSPVLVNIILFGGLILLGAGFLWEDRRRHLLRIVGSLLLAGFFAYEVLRIIEEGKDLWNITFTAIAAPVFLFVAWQEYLSWRWDEDAESLKWIAGTAAIAGLIYYSFDRIPIMAAGIIWVVAAQSIWMGQLFGYGYHMKVGEVIWGSDHVAVDIINADVRIILACTGIEAIVIFVGAIFATQMVRDPWKAYRNPDRPPLLRLRSMSEKERMTRALLITISIIWVGNLLRNVMIIYLVDERGWDFDFVHSDIGKSMSFVILLVLAFITFNLVPEMLDNIAGIVDLVNRKSPEERRSEELAKQEKEAAEGDEEPEVEDGPPDTPPEEQEVPGA